jgi:hypothetical protein
MNSIAERRGPTMKMSKRLCLTLTLTAVIVAVGIVAAEAGGAPCTTCYRRVVTPPVYGTVAETVVVSPARTVAETIPAEYRTVQEQVVITPARTVEHVVPATFRAVAEEVLVAPARKEWRVVRDAYGRDVGCWVAVAPVHRTHYRHVVDTPARLVQQTIPAVYGTRPRTELVRPAEVVHRTIPAVTEVRHRQVLVKPGSDGWQPVAGGYRGGAYAGQPY